MFTDNATMVLLCVADDEPIYNLNSEAAEVLPSFDPLFDETHNPEIENVLKKQTACLFGPAFIS